VNSNPENAALGSTRWLARGMLAALLTAGTFAAMNVLGVPSGLRAGIATVLMLLPVAATAGATILAATRSEGRERRFWIDTSISSAALLVGEAVDIVWRLHAGPENVLLAAQITTFLAAAFVGALAGWYLVGPDSPSRERIRGYALDLAVILLGMLIVMLIIVLPSIRNESGPGYVSDVLFAVYPSLALGLVVFLLVFKRTAWSTWHVLITAWLGVLGVKHVLQVLMIAQVHSAPPGSWASLITDTLLVTAYTIGFFAALCRLTQPRTPQFRNHVRGEPAWPSLAAPTVLIILSPIMYLRVLTEPTHSREIFTIMAIAMLIGLATTVRTHDLALENSSLRRRSTTDPLTGLFNHRHFHERLDAELARTERDTAPLSVAIMDVDDFDRVNNIYGHAVGDRRLRSIADRLFAGARGSDIVCRLGGDEFAVVMPDTDPVEAYKACLRLQDELRQPDGVCPLPTAVSIGVASAPGDAGSREELVQKADGALYWAKFHGREQVVIFDAALVQALGPEQRIAMLQEEAYLNMVQMLASAVDARDPYTQRHSSNVAALSVALAEELGLSEAHAAELQTAALLHDVGKIGIPDAILRKAAMLTDEERAQVAEHPQLAARILSAIPRREILPWIESHHERWDGAGYPRGLAGEAIPLEARIIALCDAYDAITTDRPYRNGRSRAEARRELLSHAGSQFDPELTVRFVSLVERREETRSLPQAGSSRGPVARTLRQVEASSRRTDVVA